MTKTSFTANGNDFFFIEGGIAWKSARGQTEILWDDLRGLKAGLFSGKPYLAGRGTSIPLDSLEATDLRELVLELYRRWKGVFPDRGKKNAFDYVEGGRNLARVVLIVSLLFSLPVGIVLMNDAREQQACSRLLRQDGVSADMQVTKAKKVRNGQYDISLSFTTPEGVEIKGKDQFITSDKTDPPAKMPVVYSRSKPSCWSLTPSAGSTDVNWAKRRFFVAFTLLFGAFFFGFGILSVLWSILKLRARRPLSDELKDLFQLA